jgi:type IV secretory pathway TraG/TraD family ATPase VirD4
VNKTKQQGGGQLGPFETLLLIAAATVAGTQATLWTWAGVSGVAFGAGWPHLTPAVLWHATAALPRHLSDPRQAFPTVVRRGLPGPIAFYLTLVVLVALAAATAAGATAIWRRHRPTNGRSKEHGARWARTSDLDQLRRNPPRADRQDQAASGTSVRGLGLGYQGSRLLRAEERHALVVFGPTQSGKSAGLVVPNALEWNGPEFVVSLKPDILDATIAARRHCGEVFVFDPYALWDEPSHTWSPLASSHSWNGALETAQRMASAGEIDAGSVKGGSFWAKAAEQRLAPLLYAAARTGRGMGDVVAWAYGHGGADLDRLVHQVLEHTSDPRERVDAQQALDAHLAFSQLAGETRGSIEGTAQILLSAYRSPTVVRSADGHDITAGRLLAGANTLYVISDSRRSKLLRPILIALLTELLDGAYETANRSPGRRLPRPLLVCLDELGNAAPIPNLAEIASTAASHNIQLVSIFHDLAQARSRYGDQALTVVNNHRARMLLPGVADVDTLKYFSELVGDEEVNNRKDPDAPARRRPLAPPDQLRQIKPGHGLLVYGSLKPALVRLRMYFDDRKLKHAA